MCVEKWCYDSCLGCGVDHCYEHKKELGVEYGYSVYRQGHGDGYYCHDCDVSLRISGDDPLCAAYLKMQELKEEQLRFFEDFHPREKELALRIEVMYDKRRE